MSRRNARKVAQEPEVDRLKRVIEKKGVKVTLEEFRAFNCSYCPRRNECNIRKEFDTNPQIKELVVMDGYDCPEFRKRPEKKDKKKEMKNGA